MRALEAYLCCGVLLAGCYKVNSEPTVPLGIAYIPNFEMQECAITRVVDGDTVSVHCGTHEGNVRLVGFDTPETYRPRCPIERFVGERATRALKAELRNAKTITVTSHGRDGYQRALASFKLDGVDLAKIMISKGLAVPYSGGRRIDWCKRLANL